MTNNRPTRTGRFYPNGSPAPAVMPPFLVVTPTGAWAYDNAQDCLAAARQLQVNGVQARTVRLEVAQ